MEMQDHLLTPEVVAARRAALRCLNDGRKVFTDEEAARYVDERGFAPLMHIARCELPSLSEADVRAPWEGFDITDGAWRWKEVLPQERRCAYGKFLRNRGFFVSWRLFPSFYRLCGRPAQVGVGGDTADNPEPMLTGPVGRVAQGAEQTGHDCGREDYTAGLLGRLEWLVLEVIAERAPIDSRWLWREVKRSFGGNRGRFEQALVSLQAGFRVMVAGGDLEGWSLHRWDLVERRVPPGLLAALPSAEDARAALLHQYVANMVVSTAREVAGFFRWGLRTTLSLADRLVEERTLRQVQVEGWKGTWLSTAT